MTPEQEEQYLTELLYKTEQEKAKLYMQMDPKEYDEDADASLTGFFGQMFLGAVNSAALGAPRWILDKHNKHLFKPSDSKTERIGRGIGTFAGFFIGLPGKIWSKAGGWGAKMAGSYAKGKYVTKGIRGVKRAKALKKVDIATKTGYMAAGSAATAATEFPDADQSITESLGEKLIDVPISTALGAAFGMTEAAVAPIVGKHSAKIKEFLDKKKPLENMKELGGKFGQDMLKFHKKTGEHLEKLIASKDYQAANEFIQRTWRGTTKYAKEMKLIAEKSQVGMAVKSQRDKLLSSDFVTATQARLNGAIDTTKNTQLWKDLAGFTRTGWYNYIATSGIRHLEKQNIFGAKLGRLWTTVEDQSKRKAGPIIDRMLLAMEPLKKNHPEAYKNFHLYMENGLTPPGYAGEAVREARNTLLKYGKQLEKMKLPVWQPARKVNGRFVPAGYRPFKMKKDGYFPRHQIDRFAENNVIKDVKNATMKKYGMNKQETDAAWKSWNNWLEGKGIESEKDAMVQFLMKRSTSKLNKKEAIDVLKRIAEDRKSPLNKMKDYSQLGIEARLKEAEMTGRGFSRKMSNIEYSRPIDLPFYDIDPARVMARYALNTEHRLAQIQHFGKGDEILIDTLERMRDAGGDANLAAYVMEHLTGKLATRPAFGFISDTASQNLRGLQVITKLGLATIANSSQSINTAMFTNVSDTSKNLAKYVFLPNARSKMQSEAMQMGVAIPSAMSDLMRGIGSDGSIRLWGRSISPHKFLTGTGFLAVERMNRVVAAHSAKDFLLRIAKRYAEKSGGSFKPKTVAGLKAAGKNPKIRLKPRAKGTPKEGFPGMTADEAKQIASVRLPGDNESRQLARTLVRLGQDPYKVAKTGGRIDFDDFARAARITEKATQFETGLMDLPLFWSSPEGKILTQFKPFAFKQAQLMKRMFIDEFRKGNVKPLMTALLLYPVVGEGVKDARSILTLRKRNEKGLERIAENAAAISAGGIFQDILQQQKYGNLGGFLAGPTFSDFHKAVDAGVKLGTGKPTKAENMLLKNVPVAGPALMNLRRSSKSPDAKLKEILEGARPQ